MAYGRRLGRGFTVKRGNYASVMGLRPVLFTRKRKTPTTPASSATLRLGRRVRPRMARSYVFTKTKTKKVGPKVTTHGDNQSSSVNVIGKGWLTAVERILSRKIACPQTIFANGSNTYTSTQGKQYVLNFAFLSKTELTGIETAANAGVATNNSVRFMLKTGKHILRLRNQSNSNARMTIYDIVTKRDTAQAAYSTPAQCWSKGLTDFGYATGYWTVGQQPTWSPEFNNYFAINRTTLVNLEPGQQHDHTVWHKYNKVVNSARFQNQVGTSCAGLTRFIMVVWHGTLGHESLTEATVTYLPVKLDVAYSSEYTYGVLEKVVPSYTLTDNNPTTVADFDFMGETGDADVNTAAA